MELLNRPIHANHRLHAECPVAALAALVLLAGPASAQVSVEVSPLRVELASGPGGTHTQAVTLSNQGKEPVRIRAQVMNWFLSPDGTPQFQAPIPAVEQPYGAATWVRLAPPEQVVAPGEVGTVRFTTTIPKDVADGGYRTAIMFDVGPASGDLAAARRQVRFRSRVATLVYLTIGKPQPVVDLTNLVTRTPAGQPAQVVATLRNTGRVHVRTTGVLTLYDAGGKVVRELDVPNVPVLPESERELAIPTAKEGQDPLPPGEYRVEVKLDIGLPALLVGETTLKVAR
jgi:P pilus assembly chaperone PapD